MLKSHRLALDFQETGAIATRTTTRRRVFDIREAGLCAFRHEFRLRPLFLTVCSTGKWGGGGRQEGTQKSNGLY